MDCIRVISAESLKATINLPASKSISNRVLIINALCGNQRLPNNISDCDDTRVMLKALNLCNDVIDIMAAGTAMRFLTAYLSVAEGSHIITGTERMLHRPIAPLVEALRHMGANIEYVGEEGYPPLRITGSKLSGGLLVLPGNVSSQYISALLMIAPLLREGMLLQLTGTIVSRPYINMTLSIMNEYGACASWMTDNTIKVYPKPYVPVEYTIENDWSASSYWYEMVALTKDKGAEILLPGLSPHSTQGDSLVAKYFQPLGVSTEYTEHGVRLTKSDSLRDYVEFNLIDQPDLAQSIVATCVALGVKFRFTGLQSLKIKETDRISALRDELMKLGYVIRETNNDTLFWNGEITVPDTQPTIETYCDHRMATSMAPLCLCHGALCVKDPNVVSKSYPKYWDDLAKASFQIIKVETDK